MTRTEYTENFDIIERYFHRKNPFEQIIVFFLFATIISGILFLFSVVVTVIIKNQPDTTTVTIIGILCFIFIVFLLFCNSLNKIQQEEKSLVLKKLLQFYEKGQSIEEFWAEVEKENQGYFFPKK